METAEQAVAVEEDECASDVSAEEFIEDDDAEPELSPLKFKPDEWVALAPFKDLYK